MLKGYRLRDYDIKLILLVLALSVIGIFAIGSAEEALQSRQIMGVIMGVFLMLVISLLDYTVLLKLYWLLYAVNIGLLVLVQVIGEEHKGAQRWLQVGSNFTFQPSETAKILLILFFAQFIMKHRERFNTFPVILCCVILVGIPFGLIVTQPDLSTSIVLLVIFCVVMFAGGLNYKIILGVLAVAVPALTILIALAIQPESPLLTTYQQGRIFAFTDPAKYPNEAYQQLNSVTAIASGMLDGKGYKNNESISVLNGNFVAESQTDFIFTVIGEEFGFKGSIVVIGLLTWIALECVSVARRARDVSGTVIAAGIGGLIAFQGFINIGVATFIMPNTGLPLPFVSYGLTSLVSLFIGVGFVLNVRLQARRY